MNTEVWTTKDGRKIPIRELSDEHLHNILHFLWRTAGNYKLYLELFYAFGPQPRGDMAQDCHDSEQGSISRADAHDILANAQHFRALFAEAMSRNPPCVDPFDFRKEGDVDWHLEVQS